MGGAAVPRFRHAPPGPRRWLALLLCSTALAWGPRPAVARPEPPPRLAVVVPQDEAVAGGGVAGAAAQAAAPPLVSRGQVDLTVPLLVNGRLAGEIEIKADAQGKGELDAARLMALLRPRIDPALAKQLDTLIAGRARLPLDGVAADPLRLAYDPATLELAVTVPGDRLLAQTMSLRGYESPDPARFSPPADFAGGIALGLTQRFIESGPSRGRAPLEINADGFLTIGGFPGVTLRGGALLTERPGGFEVERLQTRLTYDSFADAIHYVAGEFNPSLTGFQGGGRMLGVGVARDYAGIRPFENIRPSGRGAITLDRASTVIVEVNGVEARRLRLDPGRYQLSDLSAAAGANAVRLYVQDEFGRREVAAATFFSATAMLEAGLTEFGAAIGQRERGRGNYGGPLIATGYIRRGLSGALTIGAGGQFAGGDWQVDGEVVFGTPIGLFRAQSAWSQVGGAAGRAVSIDWLHSFEAGGATWNLALLSSYQSRRFSSPFEPVARDNDQRWRVDARIDWRRDQLGLSLTASFADLRSDREEENVSMIGYYSVERWSFTASIGMERVGGGGWGPRALVGVSLRMGTRDIVSARADTRRGTATVEYSRYPVDQVDDLSGRVQLSRDADRIGVTGEARYFGNRFIASAEQNWFDQGIGGAPPFRETTLRASTFIGFADSTIALGRPTQGNFAIYDRHSTLKGSKVEIRDEAGLLVGRQDWLGAALVPFNRSFSPVYQDYVADPLPPGYDLGEGRLSAFPPAYSGYRVKVGSDASRVAVGYLVTADGPLAEIAGTVVATSGSDRTPRPFFTNASGRFAVDRLAPGRYSVRVGDTEIAQFEVNAATQGMIDVGRLQAKRP